MDTEIDVSGATPPESTVKKAVKKHNAKVAQKSRAKPAKKVTKKPATKKKTVKKSAKKVAKPKRKAAPAKKVVERSERLDMRLTKTEKQKLLAKAGKLRRTVTSIVLEAIEKIR